MGVYRLCEVAYTNPLLPLFKNYFTPINGEEGHGRLCPLAMPVTVVQPGFVNGGTSVASFLVWGGGGARPPNVPTEKSNLYARASERLRNIYFQVSKYICTYTMQFPFITYGIALYRQYNDNILTLSMRASGASEL